MHKEVIKITKRFYQDHVERDLPAPPIVKQSNRHIWIDASSEYLKDLMSDASFYADPASYDAEFGSHLSALVRSARATLNAIEKHLKNGERYD